MGHAGRVSETSKVHALTPEGLYPDTSAQNLGLSDSGGWGNVEA